MTDFQSPRADLGSGARRIEAALQEIDRSEPREEREGGGSRRNAGEYNGDPQLPFVKLILLALALVVLGGWLNSYGIYEGPASVALVGWLLMVGGGLLLLVLVTMPLLEQIP